MAIAFDVEFISLAERSVLCWLATVDAYGCPSVSPKEGFAVLDSDRIVIANIASTGSAKNIVANNRVCLSFIDVFVQKGYRVRGIATNVLPSDPGYRALFAPLLPVIGDRFPVRSVFVVKAELIERIVAPGYRLFPSETTEASQTQAALRAYGVKPT